jgi:hypothetical protein
MQYTRNLSGGNSDVAFEVITAVFVMPSSSSWSWTKALRHFETSGATLLASHPQTLASVDV